MNIINHEHQITPNPRGALLSIEQIAYYRLDSTKMWIETGRCNLKDCDEITYEQINQPKPPQRRFKRKSGV